jgi:integrase
VATIEKYETGSGQRYRVRYRTPDHKQTSKRGFRTKKEAELFAASVEISKAKGEFIDRALGLETVGSLGTSFMKTKELALTKSAFTSLEVSWRLRVLPRWGSTPIGAVEHGAVQDWVDTLRQTYAATTVMRDYGLLVGILDRAVRERKILAHAARGVELPRREEPEKHYLTHVQVDILAREAGEHGAMIYTLAYTGMRWGEMAGLKARNVDLTRARVRVVDNAVQVGATFDHRKTPKGRKSREIPLPAFLVAILADRVAGMHAEDRVFNVAGEPPKRPHTSRGWLAGALRRARAIDPEMPSVSPHELRHTAASLAVSAGANVKAVQKMLGHKSAAMTLDTYADLFDDDLEAVATALDQARSAAVVSKMGPKGTPQPQQDNLDASD